jgi:Arc/MetJ-type ribon-helix-helix transcriptional regulator
MITAEEKEIKTNKNIGTKLTPIEYQEINDLVNAGLFLDRSNFLREAIKDKLKSIKVIKLREVDYETAKKEVLGYYQSYNGVYMSEVAENLELDIELVINITNELIREGRVEET